MEVPMNVNCVPYYSGEDVQDVHFSSNYYSDMESKEFRVKLINNWLFQAVL